jgi:hypothetical protein
MSQISAWHCWASTQQNPNLLCPDL